VRYEPLGVDTRRRNGCYLFRQTAVFLLSMQPAVSIPRMPPPYSLAASHQVSPSPQTSRGLTGLRNANLINYEHATGTSPIAWVSIARHAPPDMDPDLPYANSGDRPGPLGAPSRARSGDTPRHPSEKAEKAPRGETRPPVPKWEPDTSTASDTELNRTGIQEARDALSRDST